MFKNLIVYRVDQQADAEKLDIVKLEERLDAARFVPCGASQESASGWIEPRGEKHGPLVESVAGQLILCMRHQFKTVPGSEVKRRLDERCEKVLNDTGRKVGPKAKKEMKEEIVRELLPQAFVKESKNALWYDQEAGLLIIDAASPKKADVLATAFVEATSLRLNLLQTQMTPTSAMAMWLKEKEAPNHLTIDRECVLQQPDSEKSSVKYSRHALELDEIAEHIEQGKIPTSLAMTYDGRISFVLTENMALRKLKLLDVVMDGRVGDDATGFDADVAISTGEISKLIPDLVLSLGGPLVLGA